MRLQSRKPTTDLPTLRSRRNSYYFTVESIAEISLDVWLIPQTANELSESGCLLTTNDDDVCRLICDLIEDAFLDKKAVTDDIARWWESTNSSLDGRFEIAARDPSPILIEIDMKNRKLGATLAGDRCSDLQRVMRMLR